jgi:serine/threonine protein kinase
VGIPNVLWCGIEDLESAPTLGIRKTWYTILVLDLLGPSLEESFAKCGNRFQLKTVLMIADQLISRLEHLHRHSLVHRDLKPANFLIGLGENQNIIHLIDFGVTKQYCDYQTRVHRPYRKSTGIVGTVLYKSFNTHRNIEESRRDDLESLGFVLMYFLRGSLPWEGVWARTSNLRYEYTVGRKMAVTLESLCEGYPKEFLVYFKYCRSLRFMDEPDYAGIRLYFKELYNREGFEYDNVFDWTHLITPQERLSNTSTATITHTTSIIDQTSIGTSTGHENVEQSQLSPNNSSGKPVSIRPTALADQDCRD